MHVRIKGSVGVDTLTKGLEQVLHQELVSTALLFLPNNHCGASYMLLSHRRVRNVMNQKVVAHVANIVHKWHSPVGAFPQPGNPVARAEV